MLSRALGEEGGAWSREMGPRALVPGFPKVRGRRRGGQGPEGHRPLTGARPAAAARSSSRSQSLRSTDARRRDELGDELQQFGFSAPHTGELRGARREDEHAWSGGLVSRGGS